MEMRGIDPRTSRMQSERSTIWATLPYAPSGNRNRGTSLEGKYVTTTPKVLVENGGIAPPASRMQSERSTIWASPPNRYVQDSNLCGQSPSD